MKKEDVLKELEMWKKEAKRNDLTRDEVRNINLNIYECEFLVKYWRKNWETEDNE